MLMCVQESLVKCGLGTYMRLYRNTWESFEETPIMRGGRSQPFQPTIQLCSRSSALTRAAARLFLVVPPFIHFLQQNLKIRQRDLAVMVDVDGLEQLAEGGRVRPLGKV